MNGNELECIDILCIEYKNRPADERLGLMSQKILNKIINHGSTCDLIDAVHKLQSNIDGFDLQWKQSFTIMDRLLRDEKVDDLRNFFLKQQIPLPSNSSKQYYIVKNARYTYMQYFSKLINLMKNKSSNSVWQDKLYTKMIKSGYDETKIKFIIHQ